MKAKQTLGEHEFRRREIYVSIKSLFNFRPEKGNRSCIEIGKPHTPTPARRVTDMFLLSGAPAIGSNNEAMRAEHDLNKQSAISRAARGECSRLRRTERAAN